MLNDRDSLQTPHPDWCDCEHNGDTWWFSSHISKPIASDGLPVQVRIMSLDERSEEGEVEIGPPTPVLWNVDSHCEVIDIDGPEQLLLLASALTQAAAALTTQQLH